MRLPAKVAPPVVCTELRARELGFFNVQFHGSALYVEGHFRGHIGTHFEAFAQHLRADEVLVVGVARSTAGFDSNTM